MSAKQKDLIGRQAKDPNLFYDIQRKLEAQFQALTRDAEEKVHIANRTHFAAVRMALDTLRNENVIREAERYPEFRERMRQQVADVQRPLRDIAAMVGVAG